MILLCCDIAPITALLRLCRFACGGVFDLLCLQCCGVLLRQCSCAFVPAMLEWSACAYGLLSLGCEDRCYVWPALLPGYAAYARCALDWGQHGELLRLWISVYRPSRVFVGKPVNYAIAR